jgi:dTDP-4-dehydrorhamnose reductase
MSALFCFGLGYSAQALARLVGGQGWTVRGTTRTRDGAAELAALGLDALVFDGTAAGSGVGEALRGASHVLVSVPPDADGDPVLRHHGEEVARAGSVRWVGYLSTIGVYGDTGGAWVNEESPVRAASERAQRRLVAESSWAALGRRSDKRVQIFRLGGIYGPGRNALEEVREGMARRIVKPGQVFNRIHVDDIARVLAAALSGRGTYGIYNVVDDEPVPPQEVVAYAARLLGALPPPEIPFEAAELSAVARSFYAANRRVRNARIRSDLGVRLAYPTFREGLRALLEAELPAGR